MGEIEATEEDLTNQENLQILRYLIHPISKLLRYSGITFYYADEPITDGLFEPHRQSEKSFLKWHTRFLKVLMILLAVEFTIVFLINKPKLTLKYTGDALYYLIPDVYGVTYISCMTVELNCLLIL